MRRDPAVLPTPVPERWILKRRWMLPTALHAEFPGWVRAYLAIQSLLLVIPEIRFSYFFFKAPKFYAFRFRVKETAARVARMSEVTPETEPKRLAAEARDRVRFEEEALALADQDDRRALQPNDVDLLALSGAGAAVLVEGIAPPRANPGRPSGPAHPLAA